MNLLVFGVLLGAVCSAYGRDIDDARIIAARSTKTAIVLTTSTTTEPFTCAFVVNNAICQRRRFKRYTAIEDQNMDNTNFGLDGSFSDGLEDESQNQREGRIALTVWTTTSSTFTITATSTNSATTFSISFFCTVNGASFPPACG